MVSHFDTTLLLIYSVRVAMASPIVGRCVLSEEILHNARHILRRS